MDRFKVLYTVQAPMRPYNSKTEKAIHLLKKGDLDSLLKCKSILIELINDRK